MYEVRIATAHNYQGRCRNTFKSSTLSSCEYLINKLKSYNICQVVVYNEVSNKAILIYEDGSSIISDDTNLVLQYFNGSYVIRHVQLI